MKTEFLIFLVSCLVVLICTPSLIKVSLMKNLTDEPDDLRKLHSKHTPTIGGVIIFAGMLFSFTLLLPNIYAGLNGLHDPTASSESFMDAFYVISALLIIFFIGIKDDIVGTAAIYKLLAHILVAMILVFMAKIRINSFHGLFGIHAIPEWASIFLTLFTYVAIINAFNFIDGIDGLAAGIGFIASVVFGFWFSLSGDPVMAGLAFALSGALIGFLFYNFSPAKIFMGDSGSLIIGLILSILGIKLIESNAVNEPAFLVTISKPLLVMGLLSYPLIDMLRIVFIRIINGISPFEADKNHLHHVMMDIKMGHRRTSLCLYLYTLSVGALVILVRGMDTTISFLIVGGYAFLALQIPILIRFRNRRNKSGIIKELDRQQAV